MSKLNTNYPLSLQDAFNNFWQTFVVDKQPRSVDGDRCIYGGLVGCAIGCSLPRDVGNKWDNQPDDEDSTGLHLLALANQIKPDMEKYFDLSGNNLPELRKLQEIHDGYNSDGWLKNTTEPYDQYCARKGRQFAKANWLTVP